MYIIRVQRGRLGEQRGQWQCGANKQWQQHQLQMTFRWWTSSSFSTSRTHRFTPRPFGTINGTTFDGRRQTLVSGNATISHIWRETFKGFHVTAVHIWEDDACVLCAEEQQERCLTVREQRLRLREA